MSTPSPVNFRAFLVSAVLATFLILSLYVYCVVSSVCGIVLCVICFICAILFLCFSIAFYCHGKWKLRVLLCAIFSCIMSIFILGFGFTDYKAFSYSDSISGTHHVTGRICAYDLRGSSYVLHLKDLQFDDISVNGVLKLTFSNSDYNVIESTDLGDYLSFSTYVSSSSIFNENGINGTNYRTNVRYYATVTPEDVKITFGKPSIIEQFTSFLRNLLINNMGERYGSIAFSMFTGDKYALDPNISDIFNAVGIGHILAVSGLHIGFVISILSFILSKANKKVGFTITSIIVGLYVILADFSPSVVRAAIMALVTSLSVFFGGRKDLLSSLCLSYCLILSIKPFYLFDVGFLLSFGAIFGIAMFSKPITRIFKKKLPQKLSQALATSISVEIALIPTMVYFFNRLQTISCIINVIVIPYVSVVFTVMVVCFCLAVIPYCGCVLLLPKWMLMPIDYVASIISTWSITTIVVYATSAVFLCYPIMFCASEFFIMPRGKGYVVLAAIVACSTFCSLSYSVDNNVIIVVNSRSTETIVLDDDETYIIGNLHDSSSIMSKLSSEHRNRIDAVYLLELDHSTVDNLINLSFVFDIGVIYYGSFDECGERLINNGLNYKLYSNSNEHYVKEVRLHGDLMGYELGNLLFAHDDADRAVLDNYSIVRTPYIIFPLDNVTYLCNINYNGYDNVYSTKNGDYTYSLENVQCGLNSDKKISYLSDYKKSFV